jgi:hypothetical protein
MALTAFRRASDNMQDSDDRKRMEAEITRCPDGNVAINATAAVKADDFSIVMTGRAIQKF